MRLLAGEEGCNLQEEGCLQLAGEQEGGCRCAVMPVQVQALAGEAGGGGPACQTECSNTRVPARVWPA